MSIRNRLTVAIALLFALTLVMLGVALVGETRANLVDQVDDKIYAVAARAEGRGPYPRDEDHSGGPVNPGVGPPGIVAQPTSPADGDGDVDVYEQPVGRFVYGRDGSVLVNQPSGFADDPPSPPDLPPVPSTAIDRLVGQIVTLPSVAGDLSYRVFVQQATGGEIVVTAAPLSAAEAAVNRLIQTLVVIGGTALLLAALASWWIIGRGLRPVDRMVDTAAAIAAGDLSQRVPDPDRRTELGRLGAALNDMLVQIEAAAAARAASEARLRRFVADAAHELRTPLTSLRGYAELYRQGALVDAGEMSGAMRRIESEGARMARLVDDLLLLARLDQQRRLEKSATDLAALAAEAVDDFRVVAPDRPIDLKGDRPVMVEADALRLRQVIDNLLTNTRVHTPAGTTVHVTVARTGQDGIISSRDEGPGISPDDRQRVFDRFWRADPSRTRSSGGTGLGLAIVASLVEAHGGQVELESEPGAGTAFYVRLPLASNGSTGK